MEKKRRGQEPVEVVITPTPEEQEEDKIVTRLKPFDSHFIFAD